MRAKSHFESKGLKSHELGVRSDVATTFEINLNLGNFTAENTPKRFGRLQLSCEPPHTSNLLIRKFCSVCLKTAKQ